jgi:hypothetical protein
MITESDIPNLTEKELKGIADYTIQKIEHYPAEYGKTVENYFDLLFPDEVKNYLIRREINQRSREIYDARMAAIT